MDVNALLRPFKVGDAVSAAGVTGSVEAVGLFGTVINTPDNVRTIVGNNKIFSETIQNFSPTVTGAWTSPRRSAPPSITATRSSGSSSGC